jgi:hypothetical protein
LTQIQKQLLRIHCFLDPPPGFICRFFSKEFATTSCFILKNRRNIFETAHLVFLSIFPKEMIGDSKVIVRRSYSEFSFTGSCQDYTRWKTIPGHSTWLPPKPGWYPWSLDNKKRGSTWKKSCLVYSIIWFIRLKNSAFSLGFPPLPGIHFKVRMNLKVNKN